MRRDISQSRDDNSKVSRALYQTIRVNASDNVRVIPRVVYINNALEREVLNTELVSCNGPTIIEWNTSFTTLRIYFLLGICSYTTHTRLYWMKIIINLIIENLLNNSFFQLKKKKLLLIPQFLRLYSSLFMALKTLIIIKNEILSTVKKKKINNNSSIFWLYLLVYLYHQKLGVLE